MGRSAPCTAGSKKSEFQKGVARSGAFEQDAEEPWSIEDAPADFIDTMCESIVGVEIRLSRIEGKWKLSQNRSAADRKGVVAGLREKGDAASHALADRVGAAR